MKDQELLSLLGEYLNAHLEVIETMAYARSRFKSGDEKSSWVYLLEWAEAKDGREELRQKLLGHYMTATMLAEGEI